MGKKQRERESPVGKTETIRDGAGSWVKCLDLEMRDGRLDRVAVVMVVDIVVTSGQPYYFFYTHSRIIYGMCHLNVFIYYF